MVLAACSSPGPGVTPVDGGHVDARLDAPAGDAPIPVDAEVRGREFAYVANYVAGISGFTIGADGQLVAMQPATFEPARHFFAVAAHPSLHVLFAAEYTEHAVDAYRIDPETGALAPIGDPIAIAHAAISIAVDPRGRFVYVGDFDETNLASYSLQTFAIDADGALSAQQIATLARGNAIDVIAAAPGGNIVYSEDASGGIRVYTVDPSGALTEHTDSPFAAQTVASGWLAFHPTKDIVYNARRNLNAFATTPATGALSALVGSPFGPGANADPGEVALAIDPRGRFACAVDMPAGTVTLHALHPDGTIAMPGTTYDAGTFAYSVAIDPDGRFVYVTTDFGNVAEFSVDPGSLALTPLTGSPLVGAVGNAPELVIVRGE